MIISNLKGIYINFCIVSIIAIILVVSTMSTEAYSYTTLIPFTIFISINLWSVFTKREIEMKRSAKGNMIALITLVYMGLSALAIFRITKYENIDIYIFISTVTACIYFGFAYVYFKTLFDPDKIDDNSSKNEISI